MIAEFLNRDVVRDQLKEIEERIVLLRKEESGRGESTTESDLVLQELGPAGEREKTSSGQRGFDSAETRRGADPAPLDDFSFVSHDPVISLLQSTLDAYFDEPEHLNEVREEPPADDRRGGDLPLVTDRSLVDVPAPRREDERRLFDKFSITDIRWVRSKLAEGIRLLRGKHAFNPAPARPVEVADGFRLVLVGDWGSGLPRARQVALHMRASIDDAVERKVPVHVAHLGDVYYSGWGHEYRKRFLPHWPVRPEEAETIGSWCLNGNHDMYSGGHGYYGVALKDPRFERWHSDGAAPSSFFSLQNRDWKIFGLDSAWEEEGLKDPQAAWLDSEMRSAGSRKTLLLSHHQLFSVHESPAKKMGDALRPLLATHPVTAWYWGHEHRCVLYAPHENVQYGRCLGDGGVPVYQWHKPGDPYKAPAVYEHRRSIPSGLESWAVMGFAVLDFEGPRISVKYIDETGYEHKQETIA